MKILDHMKMSSLVHALLALFILVVVFWAGVAIGWRKAEFSYRLNDNYPELVGGHGAVGKVMSVSLPTIIISEASGVEKTVYISTDTIVKSGRGDIASTTITDQDSIIVIGFPNTRGQVMAKLIRILPPPQILIASTSSSTTP